MTPEEWKAKWPHYCRTCEAAGGAVYYENHTPSKSGFSWPEQITIPCDDCIGENKCSRCGAHNDWDLDETDFICAVCGWDYNNPDTLPEEEEDV